MSDEQSAESATSESDKIEKGATKRVWRTYFAMGLAFLAGTAAVAVNVEAVERFIARFRTAPEERLREGLRSFLIASHGRASDPLPFPDIEQQQENDDFERCWPHPDDFQSRSLGHVHLLYSAGCAIVVHGSRTLIHREEVANIRRIPIRHDDLIGIFEITYTRAQGSGAVFLETVIIPVTEEGVRDPMVLQTSEDLQGGENANYVLSVENSYVTSATGLRLNRRVSYTRGRLRACERIDCTEVVSAINLPPQTFEWGFERGFEQIEGYRMLPYERRRQVALLSEIYSVHIPDSVHSRSVVPLVRTERTP